MKLHSLTHAYHSSPLSFFELDMVVAFAPYARPLHLCSSDSGYLVSRLYATESHLPFVLVDSWVCELSADIGYDKLRFG
jgi:hypothetical protein